MTEVAVQYVAPISWVEAEELPLKLDDELSIDRMSSFNSGDWAWTADYSRDRIDPEPAAIFGARSIEGTRPVSKDHLLAIYERVLRVVHLLRLQCRQRVSSPWLHIRLDGGAQSSFILSPKEEGPGRLFIEMDDAHRLVVLWRGCNTAPRKVLEALRWFGHSKERHREEDRAIDIMTAAEGLFLDERQELGFRLSLRTAHYCSRSTTERGKVFDHIKAAYKVRSKLVHGDSSSDVRKETGGRPLSKFTDQTESLLRGAIVRALEHGLPTDWDAVVLGLATAPGALEDG